MTTTTTLGQTFDPLGTPFDHAYGVYAAAVRRCPRRDVHRAEPLWPESIGELRGTRRTM